MPVVSQHHDAEAVPDPAHHSKFMGAKFDLWTAASIVLILVGIGLRWRMLASNAGRLDGDEAVVGLMADRIRAGHLPPLFFWGQYYGGTTEPTLVAFAFLIHRSALMVKLVPLGLSAIAAVLVTRTCRYLVANRRAATFAGALFFAWPGTVWIATKERGFYWLLVVLMVTSLLLALRIRNAPNGWPLRDAGALGLVAGFGWYQSSQVVFVLVPLGLWLLVRCRPTLRALGVAVVGALVGAAPWLYGYQRYGDKVFSQSRRGTTYFDRVRLVVGQLLGRALGLRSSYNGGWLIVGFGLIVYCAAIAALFVLAWRSAGTRPSRLEPLCWIALAMPFLIAVPSATSPVFEPRFGLLLVPIAALLVAASCTRTATMIAVAVVAITFGVANTHDVVTRADRDRLHLDLAPAHFDGLAKALHQRHIKNAYADFWIAYPFSFETGSQFTISALDLVRNPYAQHTVDRARTRVWILFAGGSRDKALPSYLRSIHVGATRERVANGFALYTLDRWIDPPNASRTFWFNHRAGRQ